MGRIFATVDLLKDEATLMMQVNMYEKVNITCSSSKGRKGQWPHLLLCFVIFTMVSSVAGHLPLSLLQELRKSNAKTDSSKVDVPASPASSSSPDQSLSSSSAPSSSASSDLPDQQRVALVYLPNRDGNPIAMDKSKFTEFKMPSASVMSPYYLSISSKNKGNSGRTGVNRQQTNQHSTFSFPSNAKFRYPGSYTNAGRNLKVSLPSCSTLKSLWRSGKLLLADSLSPEKIASLTMSRSRQPFKGVDNSPDTAFVYGHIVTPPPPPPPAATSPPEMIDNEIVDGSIANLPPGRFGEFVRNDDLTSSQDYPVDTLSSDRIQSLDINTGSTSRPFVKLSSRSDSYSDGTQIDPISSIENGRFSSISSPSAPASSSSSSSSPSKAGLSSEFFNVWHNGPVNF